MEKKVGKVMELGFTREDAIKTLSCNSWRLDSTIDKLFGENGEDGIYVDDEDVVEVIE